MLLPPLVGPTPVLLLQDGAVLCGQGPTRVPVAVLTKKKKQASKANKQTNPPESVLECILVGDTCNVVGNRRTRTSSVVLKGHPPVSVLGD